MTHRSFEFGSFRLETYSGRLFKLGHIVHLGHRASMILKLLVERAGEVVTQAELIEYVWPDSVVEENNLRVQMSALRKILGTDADCREYICNIPGRGYKFVAPCLEELAADIQSTSGPVVERQHTEIIGRDDVSQASILEGVRTRTRPLLMPIDTDGTAATSPALSPAEQGYNAFRDGLTLRKAKSSASTLSPAPSSVPTRETSSSAGDRIFDLNLLRQSDKILLVIDNGENSIFEVSSITMDRGNVRISAIKSG